MELKDLCSILWYQIRQGYDVGDDDDDDDDNKQTKWTNSSVTICDYNSHTCCVIFDII